MPETVNYFLVIPAAGSGRRFAGEFPKQYALLNQLTIIEHTLKIFLDEAKIKKIIIALAEDDKFLAKLQISNHPKIETVIGGSTRMDSVLAALNKLKHYAQKNDYVLVHDAVRPFLSKKTLFNLIDVTKHHPIGGILALPVSDTIKSKKNDVYTTLDRENLYQAQTPQLFRYAVLLEALHLAKAKNMLVTDEAMAVEALDKSYILSPGSKYNLKITYPEDLILAELLIQQQEAIL